MHATDAVRLTLWIESVARSMTGRPIAIVVLLTTVVMAAVGVGLAAQVTAKGVETLWLGQWDEAAMPLANWLLARRRRRYMAALSANNYLPEEYLPARPTWIGDRIRLADKRVYGQYGLHLALVWPRLWQLLSEPVRAPIKDANDHFHHATHLGGWGLLYIVVGVMWWPALAVGVCTFLIAWYKGRSAVAALADLVEATVDTHHRALAEALGVALPHGRLTSTEAAIINDQLNKGA